MDAKTFDKSKLPSRHVTVGPGRAPHRSATTTRWASTEEEIDQPFVGVATCWNEAAPCNIALMRQAQSVKKGVNEAGGTPREFSTITVTDGIAMGHQGMKSSLVSREVIADSVELTMRGHCYDALVGLAGCDKSLPGMMMAMLRLNVPSVFMYGGSILPGTVQGPRRHRGRRVRRRSASTRPATCRTRSCTSSSASLARRAGACGGQFTANTMAWSPRRSAWRCPARPARRRPTRAATAARSSGAAVMELLDRRHPPARHLHARGVRERRASSWPRPAARPTRRCICRPWRTRPASASTCSTCAEIMQRTPYIADLKPGGKYVALDVLRDRRRAADV